MHSLVAGRSALNLPPSTPHPAGYISGYRDELFGEAISDTAFGKN